MLIGAASNVQGAIVLKNGIDVDLSHISSATDCANAAKDGVLVAKLEELVSGWKKQIEQVTL